MKVGSLFSGYGGLDISVEAVFCARPAWFCEFEKAPSRILARHWPDVPNLGDITAVDWSQVEPVDIITGGFPCQDVSHAGRRAGLIRDGDGHTRSGLWGHMLRAVDQLRPRFVVAENVRGLLSATADSDVEPCPFCMGDDGPPPMRALGAVLADLADVGYDAAWCGLRAADVGAPHGRFRIFILAWPADAAANTGRLRGQPGRIAASGQTEGGQPQPVSGVSGGVDALALLPTPAAQEAGGTIEQYQARFKDGRSSTFAPLAMTVEQLLPTPRATDGTKGGPNQRGSSGDLMLPSAVLLPTPTATDHKASGATYSATDTHHAGLTLTDATVRGHGLMPTPSVADVEGGRKHRSGERSGELLLNGLAAAQRFGDYAPAIARWESALRRESPPPTEPTGKGGAHRLSPRFVEFMMGLPDGWVTDTATTRNEKLKALGNGVVPQQAEAALRWLLRHAP